MRIRNSILHQSLRQPVRLTPPFTQGRLWCGARLHDKLKFKLPQLRTGWARWCCNMFRPVRPELSPRTARPLPTKKAVSVYHRYHLKTEIAAVFPLKRLFALRHIFAPSFAALAGLNIVRTRYSRHNERKCQPGLPKISIVFSVQNVSACV